MAGADSRPGPLSSDYFFRPAISVETTDGSARVEVSPRLSVVPAAILTRIRRMILPERVLGKAIGELDDIRGGDGANLLADMGL